MLAVDISNYGGELSADTVSAWKDAGITRVIVGVARDTNLAHRQLRAAADGGMEVQAYCYMYPDSGPDTLLERVAIASHDITLSRVWVDFEEDGLGQQEAVCTWIQRCLEAAEGRWPGKVGVYTGRWWWVPYTGNTERFCHYPLWVAQQDGDASLSFAPFGGWQECAVKQYTNTTEFCGYSVDLNFYEEDDVDEQARKDILVLKLTQHLAGLALKGEWRDLANALKYVGVTPA